MPFTECRVVWALGETMAIFCPTILLSRLDLPVLGRPASATVPQRNAPMAVLCPQQREDISGGLLLGALAGTAVPGGLQFEGVHRALDFEDQALLRARGRHDTGLGLGAS